MPGTKTCCGYIGCSLRSIEKRDYGLVLRNGTRGFWVALGCWVAVSESSYDLECLATGYMAILRDLFDGYVGGF